MIEGDWKPQENNPGSFRKVDLYTYIYILYTNYVLPKDPLPTIILQQNM